MTGIINNWDNLNVTGVIRPDAVETDTLLVNGVPVLTQVPDELTVDTLEVTTSLTLNEVPVSTYTPTPVANIPDADVGTEISTINAILAALQSLGLMEPPTP